MGLSSKSYSIKDMFYNQLSLKQSLVIESDLPLVPVYSSPRLQRIKLFPIWLFENFAFYDRAHTDIQNIVSIKKCNCLYLV